MEVVPGINITIDSIVNLMVEASFLMLCVMSLIMIRQESLMDKVVSYSIGGSLKALVWGFCALCTLITVLVIVI